MRRPGRGSSTSSGPPASIVISQSGPKVSSTRGTGGGHSGRHASRPVGSHADGTAILGASSKRLSLAARRRVSDAGEQYVPCVVGRGDGPTRPGSTVHGLTAGHWSCRRHLCSSNTGITYRVRGWDGVRLGSPRNLEGALDASGGRRNERGQEDWSNDCWPHRRRLYWLCPLGLPICRFLMERRLPGASLRVTSPLRSRCRTFSGAVHDRATRNDADARYRSPRSIGGDAALSAHRDSQTVPPVQWPRRRRYPHGDARPAKWAMPRRNG